ncbi:MAG: PAS domain-containing protein, partial [Proteobacteria bacterium]
LLIGAAILHRSFSLLNQFPEDNYRVIPLTITTLLMAGFLALWQVELLREAHYLGDKVSAQAEKVRLEVESTLKQTSRALSRYATRIEYLGTRDKKYLKLDSQSYIEQLPILKRIGITDSRYRVLWSYPESLNYQVLGLRQDKDPIRLEAILDAKQKRAPSLSRSIQLRSGGTGFLIPVPLFAREHFNGIVYATVQADRLFNSFNSSHDYEIAIYEGDSPIFRSVLVSGDTTRSSELKKFTHLKWGKTEWKIVITPTTQLLMRVQTWEPYFVLFIGFNISLLLGWFLQAFFKSRRDEVGNAEWRKAILNASAYSIISTDADGVIQTFNDASARMLGYEPSEVIGKSTPGLFHLKSEVVEKSKTLSRELGREIHPGMETFTAKSTFTRRPDE